MQALAKLPNEVFERVKSRELPAAEAMRSVSKGPSGRKAAKHVAVKMMMIQGRSKTPLEAAMSMCIGLLKKGAANR
jgi:hypothetical protein